MEFKTDIMNENVRRGRRGEGGVLKALIAREMCGKGGGKRGSEPAGMVVRLIMITTLHHHYCLDVACKKRDGFRV